MVGQTLRVRTWLVAGLLALVLALAGSMTRADLRSAPAWYDENSVATGPDWHYRIPVNIPAGAPVNATIRVDIDFAAQLATMGVSGTFDVNSPRIVRSTGALAGTQEFTDRIFGSTTDAAGNARGEVRFLLQDAGPATYFVYFDVLQNGTKTANPQTPINGNFERGAHNTAQPTGWNAPVKNTANFDAAVKRNEVVPVLANPTSLDGVNPRTTNGSPRSGDFSYLYGWRDNTGTIPAANPGVTFSRSITVPATNPGDLVFWYRVEGFDSSGFDTTRIDLVNSGGTVLVEMVGPTAGSYATKPWSPNLGTSQVTTTAPGYRNYNGFDCGLNNIHTLSGTTFNCKEEKWFQVTQSLAAYAGQTITFRVRSFNDSPDQSWYHIDDVEWSVVEGSLGTPQAFGTNINLPAPATGFAPGQVIPVTAQVDASPTAATTPVTAALFDAAGTRIAGPFTLYNDGTHGDASAGDALWTNDGNTVADAVTIPATAAQGSSYILRVFARDATTSTIGAQNGLARGPGTGAAAETQANFWNVDEITFSVQRAAITITKTSTVVSDPANTAASGNAKFIPGAVVRYCLLVSNGGPLGAGNVIVTDTLPAQISFIAGSMNSGASCATAATAEDDNNSGADESDPFGASFSAGTLITMSTALANGAVMALVFDARIN